MIVPILNGILGFRKAPVTWLIFCLNLCFFVVTSDYAGKFDKKIEALLEDKHFISTQGKIFSSFIEQNPEAYSTYLKRLSEGAKNNNEKSIMMLGGFAFRDQLFSEKYNEFSDYRDNVAYSWWKQKYEKYLSYQLYHPNYVFGLSSNHMTLDFWISYQFFHSGFAHIFGNMVFLLIVGSVLEPVLGSAFFFLFYLLSGMVAAGTFMFISGFTPMPLVGASGSISAIFALFCVLFWKRPVRFFYLVLWPIPQKNKVKRTIGAVEHNYSAWKYTKDSFNYLGYVYLPSWVAFCLWFIGDLTGYIKSQSGIGGIAYTAHLGGELVGALCGVTLVLLLRWKYKGIKKEALPATRPLWSVEPLFDLEIRENEPEKPAA